MVMAGGTGGHVFPALAVAAVLQNEGWEIRWLGTSDRMEAHLVPQHGIEIDFIEVKGLRGASLMGKLSSIGMLFKAISKARQYIISWEPDVILGMGGYVSGPGGIAAYLSGVPIVLHEQNAVAGLTNKWLSKIATQVLQAFPGAFSDKEVVGNPVRKDLCELSRSIYQDGTSLNILVMGGSQGARILNQLVPDALALLRRDVRVRHQAGKGNQSETLERYLHKKITNAAVTEFIEDVAEAYQWADIIICRSGALTVSEVAAGGVPAIFVPFLHKDRQQALNATQLVEVGGAVMIEQPQLTPELLAETLESLDSASLQKMSEAARSVAIVNAAERVASVIAHLEKSN